MGKWILEFYRHVGNARDVLSTRNNFSAHYSAVELYPPPSNIKIFWLPANSTSQYQSFDQGIIQNCKVFCRRYWLGFVLQAIEEGTDPQLTVNIRLVNRWILRSWNNEVTNTLIHNCLWESIPISRPIALPTPVLLAGLSELFNEVVRAGDIRDSMAIDNFLNPIEEEEEGIEMLDQEMILQEVIWEHLVANQDEEEVVQDEQLLWIANEAEMVLKVLIEYIESQGSLSSSYLRVFER